MFTSWVAQVCNESLHSGMDQGSFIFYAFHTLIEVASKNSNISVQQIFDVKVTTIHQAC